MKNKIKNLSPPQLLITVFLFFIILGTFLLKLPFATTESVSWLDALFTATSAMTVTGLIVVDTGTAYTLFGEIIIMSLIQIGGLGIMSFAMIIFIMLGKKIGFKERLLVQQALNQTSFGGVIRLVKHLFIFSFIVEGFALILLASEWIPEYGWGKGFYYSLFHSISAFNNAGFSIWSDSLMGYVGNPLVNIVIAGLFIIGGIGFTVLTDMWYSKEFRRLSLHTKLMLIGTLIINIVAMFLIFVLEFNNPKTLGELPLPDQILGSFFQAVTPRTAGFNSIDIGSMEDPTILLTIFLMFIGAGSASTGGGIKLTTFLVIILSVFAFLRDKNKILVFSRTIDHPFIFRALAITMISVLLVFSALFVLTITEKGAPFIQILFEVVSAFGTVGLSMGLTGTLTWIGKCIIIFVMFVGKLGPLTLAFSLSKPSKDKIGYPKEDILTG
ncbi:trk system potassium uptake protein TrkH [Bacillus pakistanensis]|uniref:Trk system potassium uptake protein TrkH n=1 Tax=Rossellomorea pakistanensis TaxID=992288 RepID=A0ABS2NCT2_9BACI|nr:TrkH family potassium uptake protein [Bacillus pakistanensis]MBM7585678.1 trk system potassium uptake protein TrkH [Bacillus pakistanensis]